jgi:RNA polymerase sigma-70 factor (ECF subfamily)
VHSQDSIRQLTDNLFRREAGKMISVLTKIFGAENLEMAEDVVQDTFVAAINSWTSKEIPDNPSGWLVRVAKNKALDIIRRNRFSQQFDFTESDRALFASEYTLAVTINDRWNEAGIEDDLLRMMFACCHPDIQLESQITLMLKTLCGFSVAEIAKAFLTSEQSISKRLYRTKEFFRTKKVRPELPHPFLLKSRTEAVLRAIYLLFNEGYNATEADEHVRRELLEQAIYLGELLSRNEHTQLPEVFAALALMSFHIARIESRISSEGEIVLLADQDRNKWNADLIQKGNDYLNQAATGDSISNYHIEAAIAYEHCVARSFEETNWQRILNYYDWLFQQNPSALIALNRLMVVFKLQGAAAALSEAQQNTFRTEWEKYYLYHSLMGEILTHSDSRAAAASYERALTLTQSKAEQTLLKKKMELLSQNNS